MYDSIFVSSCLFGSVYLMTLSLGLINMTLLENKKIPRKLIIINGLTFIISGSVFLYFVNYTFNTLKVLKNK